MSKTTKTILMGLAGATMFASAVHAGGFSRGNADTDILYEQGNFVSRLGATVVSPSINVRSLGPVVLPGTVDTAKTYVIPSAAVKVQATDNIACAGTYTTPFGGSVNNAGLPGGADIDGLRTVSQEFTVHEFGATCSYGMNAGPGKIHLIGGVFMQTLDFDQIVSVIPGNAKLSLSDSGVGYRVGAAYEVPEIALRAQLMYRSAVRVNATGAFTSVATGVAINPNASGNATFPQSVELKVQSGVAPGWLVYGSVKWTDWSVFRQLRYVAIAPSSLNFFWRDGWTVNAGVAHQFTDALAGTVNVTWDRGVGTGFDLQSPNVWSVAVGGSYKLTEMAELRGGVSYSWFGGATQRFTEGPGGIPVAVPGPNGFKSTGNGNAIAGNLSLKFKF